MSDPFGTILQNSGRGTGRTSKLLRACPPGGVFITHTSAMVKYIEHYLNQEDRADDGIIVCSIESAKAKLRGTRRPVTIDHYVMEPNSFIDREDRAWLMEYCRYHAPFTVMLNSDGNIQTWWSDCGR